MLHAQLREFDFAGNYKVKAKWVDGRKNIVKTR